jgi:hypothetical protein
VLFNINVERLNMKLLKRDPGVTACVFNADNPYQFVSVSGSAERTTEGVWEHIDTLSKRYRNEPLYRYRDVQRVIVRVRPNASSPPASTTDPPFRARCPPSALLSVTRARACGSFDVENAVTGAGDAGVMRQGRRGGARVGGRRFAGKVDRPSRGGPEPRGGAVSSDGPGPPCRPEHLLRPGRRFGPLI